MKIVFVSQSMSLGYRLHLSRVSITLECITSTDSQHHSFIYQSSLAVACGVTGDVSTGL